MKRVPDIDVNKILNSTPSELKAEGSAKLPNLLLTLGNQIPTIIQPSLENLITKYNINAGVCPVNSDLTELINQRNNIVNQLNRIGVKLNQTGNLLTGVSNFLEITIGILTAIDTAAIVVSLALKIPPLATLPVPGAITSGLNDVQTAIRKVTFDKYGNSKLSKILGTVSNAALVISIIGSYILKAIETLKSIDLFIKQCDEYANLDSTSPEIDLIVSNQVQANISQNQNTYNGFVIEIEEVPYIPNVTRRRAVGKNQQGIVLIQTELSFTTNNQTLINELKLIIDRDNLKGY
jgi:hypothetical protein